MTPDIVNTLCREVLGTAPESLSRAGERIRQNGYFDPAKASRIKQEAVCLKSCFESIEPVSCLDDISTKNLMIHSAPPRRSIL